MKKFAGKDLLLRLSVVLCAVLLCISFAPSSPFWQKNLEERLESMSARDVRVRLDNGTIRLTNLITGEGLEYGWKLYFPRNPEKPTLELLYSSDNTLSLKRYEAGKLSVRPYVRTERYVYAGDYLTLTKEGTLVPATKYGAASRERRQDDYRTVGDIVSLAFLLFLLATAALYYLVPKKFQWLVLLAASVFFYCLSGIRYLLFLLLSSAVSYGAAVWMSGNRTAAAAELKRQAGPEGKKFVRESLQRKNRNLLILALLFVGGILAVIKYGGFAVRNFNLALPMTHIPLIALVMPLGLSFYSFALIGYLVDIYRGKYAAETNFLRFFLFASFFPHISQGPIARYDELSPQFAAPHRFDYDDFCRGAQRILWGFFLKLVLADRISAFVSTVYGDVGQASWLALLAATFFYSIQIYADFSSSMEIALGSAQLFGIRLSENFLRPYFSRSMPEFWRRWHISLGRWFKDYVFYPVSMSKPLQKFGKKLRAKAGHETARIVSAIPPILSVWLLTGLWHGAAWQFVAWGLFHGVLILLSTAFSERILNLEHRLGIRTEAWYWQLLQMGKVFLLCMAGRVFFCAKSLRYALAAWKRIFTLSGTASAFRFEEEGLLKSDLAIACASMLLLLTVSLLQEYAGSVREIIAKRNIAVRWTVWLVLLFSVLIFGVYGPDTLSTFIYGRF